MAADQRHRSWQGRTMKQDFIRVRSSEQKSQRMADIKRATAQLYRDFPYHEITLTTIAVLTISGNKPVCSIVNAFKL